MIRSFSCKSWRGLRLVCSACAARLGLQEAPQPALLPSSPTCAPGFPGYKGERRSCRPERLSSSHRRRRRMKLRSWSQETFGCSSWAEAFCSSLQVNRCMPAAWWRLEAEVRIYACCFVLLEGSSFTASVKLWNITNHLTQMFDEALWGESSSSLPGLSMLHLVK